MFVCPVLGAGYLLPFWGKFFIVLHLKYFLDISITFTNVSFYISNIQCCLTQHFGIDFDFTPVSHNFYCSYSMHLLLSFNFLF